MTAAWLLVPLAYLLGSVPFGLLLGRAWGVDVRTAGSRNIGATNVWRTCGPVAGCIAFALDVLKGLVPVLVGQQLAPQAYLLHVLCGMAALAGHSCSAFLKFHGGKGVSTSLGLVLALAPLPALTGFGVWALLVKLTGYVSVGSLLGSLTAGILATAMRVPLEYALAVWLGVAVIWLRHRANIGRLRRGEELRFGSAPVAGEGEATP